MRRPLLAALTIVVGLLVLADFLVVNDGLAAVTDVAVRAAVLAAAGVALAGVASLAARRGADLWQRRGDPVGAALVLAGMVAVLVAGLRPGAGGAADPAVSWIVAALLVPIGASLFGLLFISTLAAARRSVAGRSPRAVVLVVSALVTLVLLLPLGGTVGASLADAASWTLAVPIGAVFRGFLIGIGLVAAVVASRVLLGIGATDD